MATPSSPRSEPRPAGAAPFRDPLTGVVIDGKYEIVAPIGGGAMGTVYRARHVTLGAWRAVKVMRPDLAGDPSFVERFQAEARLLEGLRHPHLVALYDFGCLSDGAWYIVSEFVEGETLAALLKRGITVSPDAVARVFGQLIDGLLLAHRKGIIHRDISPDNIMIVGELEAAKLIDFGIAKDVAGASSSLTGTGFLLGKIGYAAPEQMGLLPKGEAVDPRVDVFSLAAVLYRVLAGQLPWSHETLSAYVHDLLIRPEDELRERIQRDVSKAWRGTLERALARQPRDRTPGLETFRRELLESAHRAGEHEASRPLARRSRLVGVCAVWAVVLVAATFALWRSVGSRSRSSATLGATLSPSQGVAAEVHSSPAPERPSVTPLPVAPVRLPAKRTAPAQDAAARSANPAPLVTGALPVSGVGTLNATSKPEAEIRLDGEVRGRTPAKLAVAAGRHVLSLTSIEGQRFDEPLDIEPGATLVWNHRFPGFASLSVTSEVWVEVAIDNGPRQQTPFFVGRLDAGHHTVRATRAGFRETVVEIDLSEGEARQLRLTPERDVAGDQ